MQNLLWNFLSEIVSSGSKSDSTRNNLQSLIDAISAQKLFLSSSCFKHLDSFLKSSNTKSVTLDDIPTSNYISNITSESIASSLFNDLDFSKTMSLIGLSRYKTDF